MGGPKGPNILVTGTPGTGKTCTCAAIAEATGLTHVDVGAVVRAEQCHEGRDAEFDAFVLDEDKLCDALAPRAAAGGCVLDFHSCDFFPEDWFDLVLVLRADTATLFDRLKARGYHEKKLQENMQCEIMQVVLEEAHEAFPAPIIHELQSNTVEEMEANVDRVKQWLQQWRADNP
ncbi:P-loop containing nucleoside triphosphate hydrolase protein [Tribonema minus]|uniref:Adenylate kinase isoenzyme 6 homolog n=1 Tax=Tribonema minus TaxID=303371 RepID=A0A835YQ97_9STRA|nr:P-loop containing nucleoside triphosphate hydrolase protein [Tribonema minus]